MDVFKYIFSCVVITTLISCNNNVSKKNKPKNLVNDTILTKTFFNSGKIKTIGKKLPSGNKYGYWKYYDSLGNLTDYLEYLNINNKEYLNKRIQIGINGDTLRNEGNFYIIKTLKDSFKVNEAIRVNIYLQEPFFSYDSELRAFLPKNSLMDLDMNFENFEKIQMYTIPSLKNDGITHRNAPNNAPLNHMVSFDLSFSKSGIKNVRGYLEEINKDKSKSRILFFDKKLIITN